MLGETIDSYVGDDSLTIHYKVISGLLGCGVLLFVARMLKGVFVRKPIKAEDHLWYFIAIVIDMKKYAK